MIRVEFGEVVVAVGAAVIGRVAARDGTVACGFAAFIAGQESGVLDFVPLSLPFIRFLLKVRTSIHYLMSMRISLLLCFCLFLLFSRTGWADTDFVVKPPLTFKSCTDSGIRSLACEQNRDDLRNFLVSFYTWYNTQGARLYPSSLPYAISQRTIFKKEEEQFFTHSFLKKTQSISDDNDFDPILCAQGFYPNRGISPDVTFLSAEKSLTRFSVSLPFGQEKDPTPFSKTNIVELKKIRDRWLINAIICQN